MHGDCFLDMNVIVIRSGFVTLKLIIQVVEVHLDFGSTRHFQCSFLVRSHFSVGVISPRNVIFVGLTEFSDHVPQDLCLLSVFARHGWSQVFEVFISFLHLLSDFSHDLWQVVLNVREQERNPTKDERN